MLWLTHHLKPRVFMPGTQASALLAKGDWLVLVTDGRLELLDGRAGHGGQVVTYLETGSLLSSLDLQKDGLAQASLRAGAEAPVELLVVEGLDLQRYLNENPALRASLGQSRPQLTRATAGEALDDALRPIA
jgi:hypothetical protein